MTDIAFTKEEFELEKQRRLRQKCDERQLAFSPHTELGLWKFCQFMCPDFYTDDKQPLIELTEIFRRVTLGELRKVLISFFPRAGKSRTTSIWIAWWLGYDPEGSFMRNCYNDNLAMDLSKSVLDIINTDRYAEVFPAIKVDPRASSKMAWQLDGTTVLTYFGAGLKGTITGRGCNRAAILDDPIKDPEEALSETYLDKLDLFIETVHNTRIDTTSDCAEIIIQTRWSSKDPIGLRKDDPSWHKFIFPAFNEETGRSVCEDMISTDKLLAIKQSWERKNLNWMFQALYQGEPTDSAFAKFNFDELNRFSMSDLEKLGTPDEIVAWCDYANKGSDYMSCPFCYRYGTRKYIVSVVFSNEDSIKLEQPLLERIAYFKPDEMVFESNAGGIEFATNLERNNKALFEFLGLELDCRSTSSNKEIRIMLRVGEIKNDCYFLVDEEQDEHYRRFMTNLSNYGKYKFGKDDAPDSLAGLLSMMSDAFEVEVDGIGADTNIDNFSLPRIIKNKILDIKDNNNNDEPEPESYDSEVEIF
jgi:hypothetical protein